MKTIVKKMGWLLASLTVFLCIGMNRVAANTETSNPASAEGTSTSVAAATLAGGIGGESDSVTIAKELLLTDKSDATYVPSVPNVTFNYTVSPITTDTTDTIGSNTNVPILKGNNPKAIGKASFTPSTTVTTSNNKSYAVSSFSVDFSGVTWAKPGIYRYIVNETGFENSTDKYAYTTTDIPTLNATAAKRVLDVFVEYDESAQKNIIKGYVLYNKEGTDKTKVSGYVHSTETQTSDVISTYHTYDLKIKNVVTGAGGDRTATFNISTKLVLDAGASYQLVQPSGNETLNNATNKKADHTSTVGLVSGQSYSIKGVPLSMGYTVSEASVTGYTTTIKYFDKETDGTGDVSGIAARPFGIVTNDRAAISPTGIALTIAPYLAMLAAVIVLGWVFFRKQQKH